jgi:hypothetical protein
MWLGRAYHPGRSAPVSNATADDREVAAILHNAMKAMGGEDKLSKIEAVTWKTTGWMNMLFQGPEHFKCTGELTIAGLDRSRSELIMLGPGGDKLRIRSVLNGDNAWLSRGDAPLKPTRHAPGLKRSLCLAMIPVTLAPLKDPRFKIEVGGDEKAGNRTAVVLNVTCPDQGAETGRSVVVFSAVVSTGSSRSRNAWKGNCTPHFLCPRKWASLPCPRRV